MFKKNQKENGTDFNQQEISTIIGRGYVFKGELTGTSVIRIEGKIIGDIKVEGGVVLGENGIIEGDIYTKSAIIYGTVHGNVEAAQLEIKKTGRIKGDIITQNLEIESGGHYNGRMNMEDKKTENQAKIIGVSDIAV